MILSLSVILHLQLKIRSLFIFISGARPTLFKIHLSILQSHLLDRCLSAFIFFCEVLSLCFVPSLGHLLGEAGLAHLCQSLIVILIESICEVFKEGGVFIKH